MRIFPIALFIIIFNFSLAIVTGLGIFTEMLEAQSTIYTSLIQAGVIGTLLIGGGIALVGFTFRISAAVAAFSLVFLSSVLMLGATLSSVGIPGGVQALLYGTYIFVYIVSLIEIGGGVVIED